MGIEIFNSDKDNFQFSHIIDSVVANKLWSVKGLFLSKETNEISNTYAPLAHQVLYGKDNSEIVKIPVPLCNNENMVLTVFSDRSYNIDIYDSRTNGLKDSPSYFSPVYKTKWGLLTFDNSFGFRLEFYFPKRSNKWRDKSYVISHYTKHCEIHVCPTSKSNIWNFCVWRKEDSNIGSFLLYDFIQSNSGQYESVEIYS